MKNQIEQLEKALADIKAQIPDEHEHERNHPVLEHAKRHPLPYALSGLGLACTAGQTLRNAFRKPEPPTLRRRLEHAADAAGEKAAELASSARHAAAELGEATGEKIHEATDAVSQKVHHLKDRVAPKDTPPVGQRIRELVDERPFVTAAGVVATGFLAGLLIPPTRIERQMFGDSARRMLADAKEAGVDAIEDGKAIVKETIAAADQAVCEAAEDTGKMIRQKLDGADEAVRQAAHEADEAAADAVRKSGEAVRGVVKETARTAGQKIANA